MALKDKTRFIISLLAALLTVSVGGFALAEPAASSNVNVEPELEDHYILVKHVRLHYVESGIGQPVILLHGNDGTLQDFTMSIFNQLSTRYKTIAFDRPGHGTSQILTHESITPMEQARILHTALQKLSISHPILVAHSWSSALALSYVLQFPKDVSGIVLLGGMAYSNDRPCHICYAAKLPIVDNIFALTYKVIGKHQSKLELEEAFSPGFAPKEYEEKFLSSMFRVSQLKAAAHDELTISKSLKQISPQYGKINLPVVIVTGDHDEIVSAQKNSYPLHKAILQSKLIVISNAGHELQFTKPEEVLKAIDTSIQFCSSCATVSNQAALKSSNNLN